MTTGDGNTAFVDVDLEAATVRMSLVAVNASIEGVGATSCRSEVAIETMCGLPADARRHHGRVGLTTAQANDLSVLVNAMHEDTYVTHEALD